ncbi:hypothetical protein [Polaromonas sp.]|uniref:hypothetical protein n=1 Tax=Polaromonas sp. TaxID=1869339 RepID=UPI0013B7C373|nr:hypothetical protein [Polaromonas sp.]NDP61298.1 hypothetical protein [Polaromonas sp.]
MRNDDTRCCGTGTCMINAEGLCWCGQRWDGEKMYTPGLSSTPLVQAAADAGRGETPPELRTADHPPGA